MNENQICEGNYNHLDLRKKKLFPGTAEHSGSFNIHLEQ